jgi:hypothetical protein
MLGSSSPEGHPVLLAVTLVLVALVTALGTLAVILMLAPSS